MPYDDKSVDVYISLDEGKKYYINDVSWVGNTVYPTAVLDNVLGIQKGDVYNQKLLNKRTNDDDDAIANYYMDNGYLFFNLVPIEKTCTATPSTLRCASPKAPRPVSTTW